jgi:hypothetical protein
MKLSYSIAVILGLYTTVFAQQVADTTYNPVIRNPFYSGKDAPVVLIDEAHNNFHTLDGRYSSFGRLLKADGFIVKPSGSAFIPESLEKGDILVIANALHERNVDAWSLPTPSAFTENEIENVRSWVFRGGSLLLIADHMPFPGAAEELAEALGFRFYNGYAVDTLNRSMTIFRKSDGSLAEHPVTSGYDASEAIDSVRTFTGQAFQATGDAAPLLIFSEPVVLFMTREAGRIRTDTPQISAHGLYQGAVRKMGKGRVAVFGEAAMFTSQYAGPEYGSIGMTSPGAEFNQQFVLNVMHWLSGGLE